MLQFRANHTTLQFAGLRSCELHRFAFHLVRLDAFTHARLKSGVRLMEKVWWFYRFQWRPTCNSQLQNAVAVVVSTLLRGSSIFKPGDSSKI
jgi:hypothetical protein